MKKKIMAFILAATMALGMATTVFADETTTPVTNPNKVVSTSGLDASKKNEIKIYKNYTAKNAETVSPKETFEFSVKATGLTNAGVVDAKTGAVLQLKNVPMPSVAKLDVEAGVADQNDATKLPVVITLPEYNVVGVYTYEITEKDNGVAGVTYHSDPITLVVTVQQDETFDSKNLVATVHCEYEPEIGGGAADKNDTFENVYSAGTLSVKKEVTGNMADRDKEFEVTVTFTSEKPVKEAISYEHEGKALTVAVTDWKKADEVYTASTVLNLKHEETVTFTNIPKGVTYEVKEREYADYEASYAYTVTYVDNDGDGDTSNDTHTYDAKDTKEIGSTVVYAGSVYLEDVGYDHSVVITNNKEAEVDTGINLDSMIYIAILAVAAVGLVGVVARKRTAR